MAVTASAASADVGEGALPSDDGEFPPALAIIECSKVAAAPPPNLSWVGARAGHPFAGAAC